MMTRQFLEYTTLLREMLWACASYMRRVAWGCLLSICEKECVWRRGYRRMLEWNGSSLYREREEGWYSEGGVLYDVVRTLGRLRRVCVQRWYDWVGDVGRCVVVAGLLCLLVGCRPAATPKPYGYVRIALPDTAYVGSWERAEIVQEEARVGRFPYRFMVSEHAVLEPREEGKDRFWLNIHYPTMNTTVHCSYKPVRGNLRALTDDALEFVYKNTSHATAIPERVYAHPEFRVYGVVFEIEGNTASPMQFFLTDSVRHFFRGAVYSNCRPNADSLAPIHTYIERDIIHLIETLEWVY